MDDLHTKVYKGIAAVPDEIRGKVAWLFKDLSPEAKQRLWIDEVAVYSVTQSQIAEQITDITAKALRAAGVTVRDATIVDAMACVGGNTLSFAGTFRKTHAVEVSSTRAECLQHNVEVLNLTDRVQVHCADALAAISDAKRGTAPAAGAAAASSSGTPPRPALPPHVDAVFFDPPWGGPEYAAMPSIDMYVGAVHLGQALATCAGWATLAVVKAPMNFNIQGMLDTAGGCAKLTQDPIHLRKMQVMTLALTPPQPAPLSAAAVRPPAQAAAATGSSSSAAGEQPPASKRARAE